MTASILPNKPFGSIPTSVLKTFNFLKAFPDGYKVWHHIAPWQEDKPDFLVINPEDQALIIKVSNTTPRKGRSPIQMLLMSEEEAKFGENEIAVLLDFSRKFNQRILGQEEPSELIKCIILFPNLTSNHVSQLKSPKYKDSIL